MKIVRVCKSMTPDQRKLVTGAGFGDILEMKCSKLNPELCRFLMGCFDPSSCALDFGDRGRIPITDETIYKVMGVPMGSTTVSYHLDVEAARFILQKLGIQDGKPPTLASLELQLAPTQPADDVYLTKFMLYLTSSVFAPTTGIKVSPRCYPSLVNIKGVKDLNWARFIIYILIKTANAKDRKNWFKACMPFLMVLYVDSLEIQELSVPEDGTRACIWTNKMINHVVAMDTYSDGSFGRLPLKPHYRNKPCLFTSEPSAVDMFIKLHVVGNPDQQQLAKYRGAVINMCGVFANGSNSFHP